MLGSGSRSGATRSHDNEGLGIDNENQGVEPNDPGDADGGANDGQNSPLISSVSTSAPRAPAPASRDSSAARPLRLSLSTSTATTAARPGLRTSSKGAPGWARRSDDGRVRLDPIRCDASDRHRPQDFVSATATDPNGSTSEFSQRLPFSLFPTAGDAAGGAAVTIQGTDFADGATVTFGGAAASNVVVLERRPDHGDDTAASRGDDQQPDRHQCRPHDGNPAQGLGLGLSGRAANFHQFYSFVTTLVRNAITVGVGGGSTGSTTRRCASRWRCSCSRPSTESATNPRRAPEFSPTCRAPPTSRLDRGPRRRGHHGRLRRRHPLPAEPGAARPDGGFPLEDEIRLRLRAARLHRRLRRRALPRHVSPTGSSSSPPR